MASWRTPGDLVMVLRIEPESVCTSYPALGLVVADDHISIIDDCLDTSDVTSVACNSNHGWYVQQGYAHTIPPDAYTDEQLRFLTLWRLQHG